MIRAGAAFVDTGAWIALALTRDPLHVRAVELWEELQRQGARLHTSVPVVLETFTFLDRNADRQVALTWKDSLSSVARLKVLDIKAVDLPKIWAYFERKDLHKLSADKLRVDGRFTHTLRIHVRSPLCYGWLSPPGVKRSLSHKERVGFSGHHAIVSALRTQFKLMPKANVCHALTHDTKG